MLTKRSLVYKFSARAGTDLELKTKVCPSFFAQFFFFRQCGVGSAGFYLHSAPRLEQAREAWVAGSNIHRKTGTDLAFKQNLLLEFWQKCRLRLITRKTNRQNSRLAQNKILIGVRIYSASQGQTSSLNKTNTEFFSEALRKTRSTCWLSVRWCINFQHVQGQTLS